MNDDDFDSRYLRPAAPPLGEQFRHVDLDRLAAEIREAILVEPAEPVGVETGAARFAAVPGPVPPGSVNGHDAGAVGPLPPRAVRRRRSRACYASAAAVAALVAAVVGYQMERGGSSAQVVVTVPPMSEPTASAEATSTSVPDPTLPAPTVPPPTAPPSPAPTTEKAPTTVPTPKTLPPTTVAPAEAAVGVYGDCATPTVRPTEIVLTCADRGAIVQGIRWTTWTAEQATGVGTLRYKECEPSCAEGRVLSIPRAKITLSAPVWNNRGQLVFSKILEDPLFPGYENGPYGVGPQLLPIQPG